MIHAGSQGPVLVLSFNRPERRNAMHPDMLSELLRLFDQAAEDDTVRAVVLAGAGESFCVGADLKWLAGLNDPQEGVRSLVYLHHQTILRMRKLPKPIVAALKGPAAGGGVSFALAADYRCAAPSASFTLAYLRLGLTPDGGVSALLARSVGLARATELLLNNRTLSADEAQTWGLVNEVGPAYTVLRRACEVAEHLAQTAPPALVRTRELLDSAFALPLEGQLEEEAKAIVAAAGSEHFPAALQSFLAKRAVKP